MNSRFKASIGLIRCLANENPYRLTVDKDFGEMFIEQPDSQFVRDFYTEFNTLYEQKKNEVLDELSTDDTAEKIFDRWKEYKNRRSMKYPYAINPIYNGGFYMDLYASFRFVYSIEEILDEIEFDGLTFFRAEALVQQCSFLKVNSSNVMMELNEGFDWNKHYLLCNDIFIAADNLFRIAEFYVCYGRDDNGDDLGVNEIH